MKEHFLYRLQVLLAQDTNNPPPTINDNNWENILFKHDRIYTHKIMHIHYTSYDVRRGEDILHVGSPHCNIMVLNPRFSMESRESERPFWYAQVIGIYHANIIYIGNGNADYQPRRLEFLWVRWYHFNGVPCEWRQKRLDKLHFPSLAGSESFGFLDPNDVLRSAHIIPLISEGKMYNDGQNASPLAQSNADWKSYVINRYVSSRNSWFKSSHIFHPRFVDRDMMMRHYWGLGVGHTYARISTAAARELHFIRPHHSDEVQGDVTEQPEDVDEDEELGDDDMVFQDDDVDSDSSSIFGLRDAEFEAENDMYGY